EGTGSSCETKKPTACLPAPDEELLLITKDSGHISSNGRIGILCLFQEEFSRIGKYRLIASRNHPQGPDRMPASDGALRITEHGPELDDRDLPQFGLLRFDRLCHEFELCFLSHLLVRVLEQLREFVDGLLLEALRDQLAGLLHGGVLHRLGIADAKD